MTDSRRSRTALNTVKVVGLMAILKGASWLFTDSSGVLGSAADSFVDVLTTLLVLWAVLHAEQPADADHPWGHGKAEGLAALFQSLFITLAGCGVIFESIHQTMDGESQVENHWLGIGVMFLCSIITLWWARYVGRVAKETGSIALEADRQHHMTDVLVNVAAMAGLGLSVMLDSQTWPDSMVGLVIGLVILNTARGVFLEGVGNLMDRGIQASEEALVLKCVADFSPRVAGFHELRSRRSGADLFLELHLDLNRSMTFVEAHDLSEEVGTAIERAIPRSQVTVHADPL